jgi:hypothetical protein
MGETKGIDHSKIKLAETPLTPELLRRRQLAKEGMEFPLDEKREAEYQAITERLSKMFEDGIAHSDILLSVLKPQLNILPRDRRNFPLTAAERSSISLMIANSKDVTFVARRKIVRPVFVVTDRALLNRIASLFSMRPEEHHGKAEGFAVAFPEAKARGIKDVQLIVSGEGAGVIRHEMTHTIDPTNRNGYDVAIDEIFAYYADNAGREGKTDDWTGLKKSVTNRVYFDTYSHEIEKANMLRFFDDPEIPRLTYEQWKAKVEAAIDNVAADAVKRGDGARRRLARAKTLDEVLAWDDLA